MITFQELVSRLNHFWEKKNCIIHFGHDLETGAGTFNPATFLRCLGPEPYSTAYVEPSRRPSDGRYGKNPNRFQLFHQYQVILKPSPDNIQQLYLESLKAIGLDLYEHDIRFVHDDWESPTLGAWGLGWEVWIDGMEISQFTYFQAIGSLPMQPIPGEITYGLERLSLFLQKKNNFFSLHWNKERTFQDIEHQNEVEWSAYNFEEASTDMWQRHFDDFEKEAKRLISISLPIPAYDFVVKASHAFNMLDARGAISVTERTGYIARIRDLARLIAIEYISSREKLGFPLIKEESQIETPLKTKKKGTKKFNPEKKADFLLEIGSEQLPPTFIPIGCQSLEKLIRKFLESEELSFDNIHIYGTPQRISVLITSLVEGTPSKTIDRKGPPASSAFQGEGSPTPQGQGFLKSLRYPDATLEQIRLGKVKGLEIHSINGIEYIYARIKMAGRSTVDLLSDNLPNLIANIEFPKKMRWSNGEIAYARPIHWIVALYGSSLVPFNYGKISSGKQSFGHAQMAPKKITLKNPTEYLDALRSNYVLADIAERKEVILNQLSDLEAKYEAKAVSKEKVMQQVLYLCEWPQLTAGTFDKTFLRAPAEVLISEMVEHQRYFPLSSGSGQLKNHFIITADNKPNALIVEGNEKVLSARLSDGVFLYENDLEVPMEKWNEKLTKMTFQKDLGSMLQKVERLVALVEIVNRHLEIADSKKIVRSALLSKSDLASELVGEFPELQGTAAKYYALAQKEDREVATALEEQWMPRGENGKLPETPTGIILSIADKIDNLLGYYSVGLKPSSSSDPYALRRQSIGVIKMVIRLEKSCHLGTLLKECATVYPKPIDAKLIEEILQFITARIKTVFEEEQGGKFKTNEIDAVLYGLCVDPFDAFRKLDALHLFRSKGQEFDKFHEVYKRAKGILTGGISVPINPSLFREPAEKTLFQALGTAKKSYNESLKSKNYEEVFRVLTHLQQPLAQLFDNVKILADEPELRDNRISLVNHVFSLFEPLLDFKKI